MNSSIMKVTGEEALRQNIIETTKRLGVELTQAEFDALTQEEKTHGTYYIKDGQMSGSTGSVVYVTTSNTALYGKSVTLTDDSVSVVSQFDNEGNASFQAVAFTGRLMVESSDGTTTYLETFNAPYYGKYSVAIGTKVKIDATLSISTSSSELYGKTITIKKDNEVVGTTAFSAQGSASYTVHETGTYTCECEGYSGSATVSAETTYSVTINAGLDLPAWITAGSTTEYPLNPSSYADFSALEADEAAVRQLMLVHNAVDYLAQATAGDSLMESVIGSDVCAKWINLSDYALDTLYANSDIADVMDTADKYGYGEWGIVDSTTTPPTWGALGNVPIMTANNAPYGTAGNSSAHSSGSYPAYKAFNGDVNTEGWLPDSSDTVGNCKVYYQAINPMNIKKASVYMRNSSGSNAPKVKIIASDDGTTWQDVSEEVTLTVNTWVDIDVESTYHPYIGMKISAMGTLTALTNGQGYKLQFYGRELKPLVPTMTADNKPKGEASASRTLSGYPAYKAFDGVRSAGSTDMCWIAGKNVSNDYLRYHFVDPTVCKIAMIGNYRNTGNNVNSFEIQGSNDGTDFSNVLYSGNNPTTASATTYYACNNNTVYSYLQILCKSNHDTSTNLAIDELQFFGMDYSEKEFAPSSTRKTIYDHGVELVSMTALHDGSATATKESNQFYGNTTASGTPSFAFITSAQVNFPSGKYSRLCGKVGNKVVGPASYSTFFYGVKSTGTYTYSDSTLVADVGVTPSALSGGALETALDVSNITGDYYVLFCAKSNNQTREASCVELWLE